VNRIVSRTAGLFAAAATILWMVACGGGRQQGDGGNNGTPATMAYMLGYGPTGGLPDRVVGYRIGTGTNDNPVSTLLLPSQSAGWWLTTSPSKEVYVVAFPLSGGGNQILVYAAGASGSAAPSRVIDLAYFPQSLVVDASGNLYVASNNGPAQNILVSVYSPDATGQAVPVRTLQSRTNEQPLDITVDLAGYIYVAGAPHIDAGNLPYSFIDVYSPDAEGYPEPIRSIDFPVFISGIAVDGNGNIFASVPSSLNTSSGPPPTSISIEEFSPDANGYAVPTKIIPLPTQTAVGFPGGGLVRFDGAGNLFTPEVTGNTSEDSYGLYKISPGSTDSTAVVQSAPTNILGGVFALN